VKEVLQKFTPESTRGFCGTCYLPISLETDINPECDIAVSHNHEGWAMSDICNTFDCFGPGILLLKQQAINTVLGLADSLTVDQAVAYLRSDNGCPTIQLLFLLHYHLTPTTSHCPDVPAASIHAATGVNRVPLPQRRDNNKHIGALSDKAIEAAVAAVRKLDSVRPISGQETHEANYSDGSATKVTIQWTRKQNDGEPDERQIFAARSHTVMRYLDQISESDARLTILTITRNQASTAWKCPCGSDSVFRVCRSIPPGCRVTDPDIVLYRLYAHQREKTGYRRMDR
jgi:hypothetical protein